MQEKQVIQNFIEAINAHDVERLYNSMAEDFVFIGAYGDEVHGDVAMKQGWEGYFEWFPDYSIEISDVLQCGNKLGVFGFASGTYHGNKTSDNKNYWRLPAAWRVIVEEDKIKLWQVYADSKIPYDIMDESDKMQVEQLK